MSTSTTNTCVVLHQLFIGQPNKDSPGKWCLLMSVGRLDVQLKHNEHNANVPSTVTLFLLDLDVILQYHHQHTVCPCPETRSKFALSLTDYVTLRNLSAAANQTLTPLN